MRPNNLVVAIALFSWALVTPAAEAATKSTVHQKSSVASGSHTKSGTRSASSKSYRGKKGKTSRYASSRARPSGPARQQTPTTERYAEIQKALAEKGYFQGEPTGEWGPDSVDALRRFQADQKLTADGKIGSLSLIALGLGPKRDAMIGAVAKPNEQTPQGQQ